MCGIFGLVTKNSNAPQQVFRGLSDIEYRGYDSWGIASAHDGCFKIIKKTGCLPKKVTLPFSSLAIGHTRWATHGGVTEENAHPHKDCLGRIVLVHNGIVENHVQLKQGLRNHTFCSETDTEVIVHLIESMIKTSPNFKTAVGNAFKKLQGMNAVVATNGQEIVACKKGSPLVVGRTKDGFIIASDPNALLLMTRDLLFLEDNRMVVLNHKLDLFSLPKLSKLEPKFDSVVWDYKSAKLSYFPHYMLKEIHEQPKVLRAIAANSKDVELVAAKVRKAFGTYLIACGSASYSALLGVYLFSKFAKKHVNFSVGSEFSYIQDYLTPESLLIAVSQSGESMDTVEPVVFAKVKKAQVVSLVNVLGSTLYRMADYPVLLQAGIEKAVASTKALTAMFATMILLVFMVARKRKLGDEIIRKSALEVEGILRRRKGIAELASKIYKSNHIYVLGRGLSYPIALETALKIKEISYIHAEGFAGGELKHGVIALIEEGTPVIVYVPNDETKDAMISNATEVKARGAFVIGIGPENNPVFDSYFKVKDTGASSVIPHTVFAQLLAYFLTLKLGLDPDKPRNLAKSVVVR